MSKRWKIRKQNAAKLEKSHEHFVRFFDSIERVLGEASGQVAAGKLWCAACGKWSDHTSGTCPTIAH